MMRVKKTSKHLLLMLFFAVCACLFLVRPVNEPRESVDEKQTETIEVAMMKMPLPAATVIKLRHINTEMLSRNELPPGKLVSPLQIIGRVLARPVVEGQVLTESCLVPTGTASLLAAATSHEMRAVTLAVSSKMMPDRTLLYPGCFVDVLTTWKLNISTIPEVIPDFVEDVLIKCKLIRNYKRRAISTTMLRGIQVLAIRRSIRGTLVTLLVDTKQAEALSLAVQNSTLSLSLRNPLDKKEFELQPLHDFRIGPCEDDILQSQQTAIVSIRQNPKWEVTLIRGSTVQRVRFGPGSSRQQLGLSSLSMTDENGDKWVLKLVNGQSLSSLKDSSAKSGPPLLVKTDVQISGRNVSIALIVEGQAGEKYAGGVQKNRLRQPAPRFNIVDEAGKVLTSGRFKYG